VHDLLADELYLAAIGFGKWLGYALDAGQLFGEAAEYRVDCDVRVTSRLDRDAAKIGYNACVQNVGHVDARG
jgi:hypothetical protein